MTATRCGLIAVVGLPNAGKSTVVNALVEDKVSIVSSKPQTTRMRIRGIVTRDDSQYVLVDTPGFFDAKKDLDRAMVRAAASARDEADIVLLIVDAARGLTGPLKKLMASLPANRPAFVALNKIDQVPKERLLSLAESIQGVRNFDATFMIAALTAKGTDRILTTLEPYLPFGPFLFDADTLSDLPQRVWAAEITREKLFRSLHQELPYGLTVETEAWETSPNGSITIHQAILINREAHRPIIIGARGQQLKAIGTAARLDLEKGLDCRVHLILKVIVKENWQNQSDHAPYGLAEDLHKKQRKT